jgi:uncharacterized protein (TIGR03083 family)
MAAHPDVDQALRHIRTVTRQFRERLSQLPRDAWERPTNCRPWRVRDLAAHVVSSGESFRMSVERGVAGSVEPAVPEAERERRIGEIAASPPELMLARLDEVTDGIERLYQRLSAEELEAICYHRRGNRTARWYICHRLAEVAFHRWDLDRSLGRDATLDEDVATFLLPTLLESNLPRIYPSGPRGAGRFRLSVPDDPARRWLLAATPDRLEVTRDGGSADVTITAAPSVLALLVYGRADLSEETRQGRAQIEGDRALAERFHTMFVGP